MSVARGRQAVDHLDDPSPEATIRYPRATCEPGEEEEEVHHSKSNVLDLAVSDLRR